MPRCLSCLLALAAALCGCYASVGPTVGYSTHDGFTAGVEGDAAGLIYVHGGGGVYGAKARDDEKGQSIHTVPYGSIGGGVFWPGWEGHVPGGLGGLAAAGIGWVDAGDGASFAFRMWGGPNYSIWNGANALVLNAFGGISIWKNGVRFYVSPQVGLATSVVDFGEINMD